MATKGKILVTASLIACFLIQAQGADKYTDGNRPYEFGFSIDGEQHRHEKKDEKGLIQGEFGFITADGVYHVTVYATDEEGRFKILSMKNIRVKPYPTYTAKQANTPVRQGHSIKLFEAPQTSTVAPVTTTTFKPISIEPPARSCSHCSLPTTSTPAPIPTFNQPIARNLNQIGAVQASTFPQEINPQSNFAGLPQQTFAQNRPIQSQQTPQISLEQGLQPPKQLQSFPQNQNVPTQTIGLQGSLLAPQNAPKPKPNDGETGISGPQENLQRSAFINVLSPPQTSLLPQQQPQTLDRYPEIAGSPVENSDTARGNVANGRTPKRLDGEAQFGSVSANQNSLQNISPNNQDVQPLPGKPKLISAEMQIVDKNTDIHRLGPGEREGLPDGITKDHMSQLLYTFNYTVGFHGHFEEGYTNGAKQGYYFVTGRNGVRTRVDYVADSRGFRPKISQEVLDLLSDDVPKPESEKDEKYGLKGYEFKWLYYPVEAKGR